MSTLELHLDRPPRIAAASAAAVHGERGDECYRLPHLWCLNLYRGEGILELRGERHPFWPGCASVTPPDTDYRFSFKSRTVKSWVHFAPDPSGSAVHVPVMQDLGSTFASFREAVGDACACRMSEPHRATARVWDVLWRLVARPQSSEWGHPILRLASDHIEQYLHMALSPEGIALRCKCSATQLNRLMRKTNGLSVMAYVRQRRVQHAVHLLRQTTLSIGRIGEIVGIPDQHLFNKTVRRELGHSPRAVRQEAE